MIKVTEAIRNELDNAVANPSEFATSEERMKLRATYETFLDQCSNSLFKTPCSNIMSFRRRVNELDESALEDVQIHLLHALRALLGNHHLLYDKTYTEKSTKIKDFLKYLEDFLKVFYGKR